MDRGVRLVIESGRPVAAIARDLGVGLEVIRVTHKKNFEAYGYRRTWKALLRAGEQVQAAALTRASERPRPGTPRRLTGSAATVGSIRSRSNRSAPMPQRWCATCASMTSLWWRSTNHTRTRAGESARAIRSMQRWPPGSYWPAAPR